jgi:predicted RNase H-like HicB family nuclease
MTQLPPLTAVIFEERSPRDGSLIYVATCPELDVTSQGDTIEHAREMLSEAVEGWLEAATAEQVQQSLEEGGRAVALMALDIETIAQERVAA